MTTPTAEIWKEFGDRLRRFVAGRVRNESDAEDILQDVFGKIHEGLGRVRHLDRLESWLFQVTRRVIVDHFRARSSGGRSVELLRDVAEEPAPATVTAEVSSWLRPMMSSLSEEDREALRLTDLEGLGQREVAARLGLSLTGAKSRVQRARRRLRETLLECCHVEMDRRGNALGYTPRRCACSGG